jgi:serine/threonine protein kinase
MPIATAAELVQVLKGCRVLRDEELREIDANPPSEEVTALDFMKNLHRRRLVTLYQAHKILAGRQEELVVGPYIIVNKIGEGGMGKVYRATHRILNRDVALKILRQTLLKNETAVKRFQREVKSAAALSHPNIVRVYDADQIGNRHFLAMEYIEGTDLSKMVKERGALSIAEACAYVRQAALGLQHAHDIDLVHRDIKPSNILVIPNEKKKYNHACSVKILDMGLARTLHDEFSEENTTELTRAGMVVGTPDYMSPEQAKNSSNVDHRSDIYSLGCTLYYLLTASVIFPKGTPFEKLMQHQMDTPLPIQQRRQDIPDELATLVHCLINKRPDLRFDSCQVLAQALEPWCTPSVSRATQAAIILPAEEIDQTPVASSTNITPLSSPFDFGADSPQLVVPISSGNHPRIPSSTTTKALAGEVRTVKLLGRLYPRWMLGVGGLFFFFITIGILIAILSS